VGRVRERFGKWIRRGAEPPAPQNPLLFTDHEEIQDIARQMARTKVEIDRSILTLRSWARDLSRRVAESGGGLDHGHDLRSLGETVGGLAHNFNNSLAAILAYTELLLRDAPKESTAHRRLMIVRDVALEASATVRRLQDFVSRQPEVAFGPVGLPAVMQEALDLTAPRWRDDAERRGVVITVSQDMEALPPVEGIAFELRDALVRLILNAVQAMPDGGELSIRAAAEESGWVVIEVRDTGIGMTEEHSRLIENRALEQAAPTGRGGRGLAEVAEIIERHGGNMSIESEPGRGTVVRLRLHASRFQIIPPAEGVVEPVHPEQASRILLVDDDPRLLTVLSDTLQACGHMVTTASKGEEALEIFDPARHDVVITDLGMPRMNGWEVAERVKALSPETPVFLLTGWGESVAAHEGSQFVDRVVAKPVSAEALMEQLAELRRTRAPAP
jgi:signal transduction histidine kinase/ActR/RegA family two-component response regulator